MSKDRENEQEPSLTFPDATEEWLVLSKSKLPCPSPLVSLLPEASGGAHRYTELPLSGTWSGIVKGLELTRLPGGDAGALSRQMLTWRIEVTGADVDLDGV